MMKLPLGVDFEDFVERLGSSVFRLPLLSQQLRHRSALGTLQDYLHADVGDVVDGAVVEFLKDLHTLSTQEMIKKWYSPETLKAFANCYKPNLPTPSMTLLPPQTRG